MTKAEREEKTERAVALSSRGWSYRDISGEIGVAVNTVMSLLGNEFARRAETRDQDKEHAIARYEEIIRAAWERYDRIDDKSLNASGLLNTIRSAQESIDKITGAQAPIKHQEVDEEIVIVWEDLDTPIGETAETLAEAEREED